MRIDTSSDLSTDMSQVDQTPTEQALNFCSRSNLLLDHQIVLLHDAEFSSNNNNTINKDL